MERLITTGKEAPQVAISWSHTGYHSDRMAFYIIADTCRLYSMEHLFKLKPFARWRCPASDASAIASCEREFSK